MEEYLIFAAIGGLLILTLFVNSVAEAYEQKQREKRIKILKIKQSLDELSDLLDRLKACEIASDIRDLLLNEIMARLQTIQRIDKHFKGIQTLIDETSNHAGEPSLNDKADVNINDEPDFRKIMVTLRRLIKRLNTGQWHSKVKTEQIQQFVKDAKLLRCEKIFQFYSDKARVETEKEKFLVAKEHYFYIIHALNSSGISTNPRVIELQEQAEFMVQKISTMIANNMKKIVNDQASDKLVEK